MSIAAADLANPCWRSIGVSGDGSCTALPTYIHCRNCPVFADAAESVVRSAAVNPDAGDLAAIAAPLQPVRRTRSMLVFRVEADWLALDVACVQEIVPPQRPHALPHLAGAGLAGLVNVRGQLVLAVDLRQLIGTPVTVPGAEPTATGGARPRVVVVRFDQVVWAFAADDVPGVMALPTEPSAQTPATLRAPLAEMAAGLTEWEDRHVVCLRREALQATLRRSVTV